MFSGGKIIALSGALFVLNGCKTTAPETASIDKVRGEMSLYSSADARTTLAAGGKQDDLRGIEERLKGYLREHRDDVQAILALAQVEIALGQLDDAEKNAQTALRRDLKNVEAKKILAAVAMRRGHVELASIFLSSVGGSAAKDSSVLNMLALVELARENHTGAMTLFKRAISANGNDLAARMNLGVLLLKYRQMDQAGIEFERILKAVPGHTDAKLHLAIVKASHGKTKDAETMLKEVLSREGDNPLALYNLAVVQRDLQEYDDALDHLKAYLRTAKGKASDNDQVFALIDEIQKRQTAKGQNVSDEEIEEMALAAHGGQDEAPPAKAESHKQAKPKPASTSASSDDIGDLEKALKN